MTLAHCSTHTTTHRLRNSQDLDRIDDSRPHDTMDTSDLEVELHRVRTAASCGETATLVLEMTRSSSQAALLEALDAVRSLATKKEIKEAKKFESNAQAELARRLAQIKELEKANEDLQQNLSTTEDVRVQVQDLIDRGQIVMDESGQVNVVADPARQQELQEQSAQRRASTVIHENNEQNIGREPDRMDEGDDGDDGEQTNV